ncbi:MAG: tetratricopeptide repeat protein [Desulfobacterales bacterium]|nr:tetratricopeptide repeat protein [Desulfobacterales bacterium]
MVKRSIRGVLVCRRDPAIFLVYLFLLNFMIFLVLPSFASAKVGTFKAPIKKPSPESTKKPAADSSAQSLTKPETMPTAVFSQMQAAPDAALDFEFEIKRLNNLLKITDLNADAFFNRGWLYEYKGDLQMAEQDYSKAIQVNNRHVDAHYNRGLLFAKMKKLEQAVQDFSATLKLEPNAVDAYCNRGNANLQLGHIDLALQDYTAGLKIRPDDADLNYNRGVVYLVKGEEGKAREDFKRAAQAGHSKAKEILSGVGIK